MVDSSGPVKTCTAGLVETVGGADHSSPPSLPPGAQVAPSSTQAQKSAFGATFAAEDVEDGTVRSCTQHDR